MAQKAFRIKEIILEDNPVSYLRSDVLDVLSVSDELNDYGNGIVTIVKENVVEALEDNKSYRSSMPGHSQNSGSRDESSAEDNKRDEEYIDDLIEDLESFLAAFKDDEEFYEIMVG